MVKSTVLELKNNTNVKISTETPGAKEPQALRNGKAGEHKNQNSGASSLGFGQAKITSAITPSDAKARTLSIDEILDGGREVIIVHNDEQYSLRLTSKNKLILTK